MYCYIVMRFREIYILLAFILISLFTAIRGEKKRRNIRMSFFLHNITQKALSVARSTA